jgi:hypothetical protein
MSLPIDHVFVFCRPGGPELAALEAAGLRVGRRRRHEGQGTANACVFFAASMLELLWIENETEARSPLAQPLQLYERSQWRQNGANPFGIALRAAAATALPVATWDYSPPYLPPGMSLRIAASASIAEPMVFFAPGGSPPPPVEHVLARATITRAEFSVRDAASPGLRAIASPVVAFVGGGAPSLRLELDGGRQGQSLDLAPELPLRVCW